MSDEEVETKFATLAEGVIPEKLQRKLLDQMWSLDKAKDVRKLWEFKVK